MSLWYYKITKDLSEIPKCVTYFEKELEDAKRDLSLKGISLEKHAASLPGQTEQRYTQLQEIEAILEYLNLQYRKTRSRSFVKYTTTHNKALSSRDAEKYVDGDIDVINMALLVNEIALLRNKYLSIHKGFDSKNWMLGHIVKLRCAGLDDARLE